MSRSGSVLGRERIVDSGPSAQRWDLVILGDGYRRDEIGKYQADVAAIVENILAAKPFDELRSAINIHRVDVASNESGAGDRCRAERRETFFNSEFCAEGIDRLLVSDDLTAIDVATDAVPEMNATLLVVNSTQYGGSGGAVPVFSLAEGAFEIALHEMGHSHFGLADEYPYLFGCNETGHDRPLDAEPVEPNVTANTDRATLKWRDRVTAGVELPTMANPDCHRCDERLSPVADGTIGLFEGARYFKCGVYRPTFTCRMRILGVPFCDVCQEEIRRTLKPFAPKRRRPVRS